MGSTPDEIAALVIAESLDHQAGTSSAPDDEDLQDSDADELETVDTNRFQFLTKRDVKDALSALEEYCVANDSVNLNLCYQMQSNLDEEIAEELNSKRSRMTQSTITSFFRPAAIGK